MKYAVTFPLLGAGVAFFAYALAAHSAVVGVLFAWLSLALVGVGIVYALDTPSAFGKRADGTLAPLSSLLWAPFLAMVRTVHALQKRALREPASHEVAANLFVGRRPHARELPQDIALVVDVCAEMPASRGVREKSGAYVFVPALDATAPRVDQIARAVDAVLATTGPVLVHCAVGRGRSAMVAACVLVARGEHATIEEAEAAMRLRRPVIRLNDRQRARAREYLASRR